jgi:hypothetical protein
MQIRGMCSVWEQTESSIGELVEPSDYEYHYRHLLVVSLLRLVFDVILQVYFLN